MSINKLLFRWELSAARGHSISPWSQIVLPERSTDIDATSRKFAKITIFKRFMDFCVAEEFPHRLVTALLEL